MTGYLVTVGFIILALVTVFADVGNTASSVDDFEILSTVEINASTDAPILDTKDYYGFSVISIGDLDGDGVNDIAVGAYADDVGATDAGAVYISFLNSDGSIKSTTEIDANTTNGPTLVAGDYYGSSVANIGDLDGDGVNDIAVGAYGDDAGASVAGAVHISFLNSDGSIKSTTEINATTTNGPTLLSGDYYGHSVVSLGDLDGDGVVDIAVGARGDDAGASGAGAVHISFLNSDGSVKSTVEINKNTTNAPALLSADGYGTSITNIGDLDGDGVVDIAVGATGDDAGATDSGAMHISFLNSDGSVKSSTEIDTNTANGPTLLTYDYYGSGIINIGDLDDDGVNDIAVGAYGDDTGVHMAGVIHIHFMNSDGSVKNTTEINANTTNGPTLGFGDYYGRSIANIGDLDDDGVDDIAVGAYGDDAGFGEAGTVHIHFMNSDGSVKSTVEINTTVDSNPFLLAGDNYGLSVASIGDLDGDGVDDIVVGAPYDDTGDDYTGAVHISYLNSDGSAKSTVGINTDTTNGPTLINRDYYGASVANIGDLDDDGVNDIAVGAYGDDTGASAAGAVYMHFMNSDGSIKSTVEINANTTNGPTLLSGDSYGASIAGIGDLDSDGVEDIIVGAYSDDAGASGAGAVHIHFMNSDGSVKSTVEINATTTNGPTLIASDFYGISVANIGDLDDDGVDDIIVGAKYDDAGASNTGAVHIHFMNSDGSVKSTTEINTNTENGPTLIASDYYGTSVAGLGDLDGDGIVDIAVGVPRKDTGAADAGAVYIHFLDSDGSIISTIEINKESENGPTLVAYDNYGSSIAAVDVDSNNYNDLVVGAPRDDILRTDAGAVHINFLSLQGATTSSSTPPSPASVRMRLMNAVACYVAGDKIPLEISGSNVGRLLLSDNEFFVDAEWEFIPSLPYETTWVFEEAGDYVIYGIARSNGGNQSAVQRLIVMVQESCTVEEDVTDEDIIDDETSTEDEEVIDEDEEVVDDEISTDEDITVDEEDIIPEPEIPVVVDPTIEPIPVHSLVKLANDGNPNTTHDSVVYFIGEDGKRHTFTHETVFLSWFTDYDDIFIVLEKRLAQYPLGSNITYHPGKQMIKFVSSPNVYAVAVGGVLRHIAGEAVAEQLYGGDWNLDIYDILESFASNYIFGDTIEEGDQFDVEDTIQKADIEGSF